MMWSPHHYSAGTPRARKICIPCCEKSFAILSALFGHRSDDDEGLLLGEQSGPAVYPSVKSPSCRSHWIGNCWRRSSSSRVGGCRPSRIASTRDGESRV